MQNNCMLNKKLKQSVLSQTVFGFLMEIVVQGT